MELQLVWGWQPALYLFLGGLGAGAFVVAACLYFFGKGDHRKSLGLVSWAAVACLAVGLLLLLTELIFPLRGLMMWRSFSHVTSWMTIGAWLLFATVIFILLAAVALTEPLAKAVKLDGKESLLKVCFGVGGVLSFGVCAYTGILLMNAPGVPLWNTLLLPCLFTVSALDTGVALNEIVVSAVEKEPTARFHKMTVLGTVVLVALEAVVVAALLGTMGAGGGYEMTSYADAAAASAAALTGGVLAPWFWALFVGVGLAVPAVCAAISHFAKNVKGATITYVGAAAVLIGGCALRFLILLAGVHADVIAVEVAKLIF